MPDLASAVFRTTPEPVRGYLFPLMSAAQWCRLLTEKGWPVLLVQGMDADPYERVLAAIERGELGQEEIVSLARAVLADAAGRPWWEAERLVRSCIEGDGRLLGMILLAGVRPETMTLASFCCAVWAQITKGADATQLLRAQSELCVPPPEVPLEELEEGVDDMSAMVQMMRGMPGTRIG